MPTCMFLLFVPLVYSRVGSFWASRLAPVEPFESSSLGSHTATETLVPKEGRAVCLQQVLRNGNCLFFFFGHFTCIYLMTMFAFVFVFFVNAGRLSRARESIRGRRGVYAPGLKWSPVPSAFVETAGGDSCRVGLAKCGTKLKWCRWVWRFIYFLL